MTWWQILLIVFAVLCLVGCWAAYASETAGGSGTGGSP